MQLQLSLILTSALAVATGTFGEIFPSVKAMILIQL